MAIKTLEQIAAQTARLKALQEARVVKRAEEKAARKVARKAALKATAKQKRALEGTTFFIGGKQEMAARRAKMMARRLQRYSNAEIAREFHITEDLVSKELAVAKRSGMLDRTSVYITDTLLPMSLNVFVHELEKGNVEVATAILEGVGVIGKNALVNINVANISTEAAETFEEFRLNLMKKKGLYGASTPVDAQVVTPASSSDPAEGSPGSVDQGLYADPPKGQEAVGKVDCQDSVG